MDDTLLLKEKWDSLRSEQPGLRIRSAASIIGVSELELLITQLGREVTILRPEFNEILIRAVGEGLRQPFGSGRKHCGTSSGVQG